MSELIERLETRLALCDVNTPSNAPHWIVWGGECYLTTETPDGMALLYRVAIEAERRRQAEEYYKLAEWLELPTDEAMAWLDATQPTRVNAALDALTQHLLGSTTTAQDGTA